MIQCKRCGKKIKSTKKTTDITIDAPKRGLFYFCKNSKSFILCDECGKLAITVVKKFVDELTAVDNPLWNGPYTIGQDFNTKDWWIYDDNRERKLPERFDTYEEAYDYTEELRRENQNEKITNG